ncbi:MAG: ATP-binding cassette domain-containing protein [Pirellulales bacterium]|nr:ATP-binding cassette domain-containing protein [Pirellulales bacterium]
MAMLDFENVSKQYAGRTVLEPLDVKFEREKTYVLLGTSGCGKSTILKLALGLIAPDSGIVRFDGEALRDENMLAVRRRVGYVIQRGGLFPHMTAADNATLVARFLRWSQDRLEERLSQLAELVQISRGDLDRFPAQLSGGQQQRVGLMRALMLEPDVLLLDEPLGALDPMIRSDLQGDLRRIFRTLNKTVVLVTHDLDEAAFFADEVLLMSDGRVVQRGTIADLVDAPADPFVAQFVNAQRSTLSGEQA